MAKIGVASTTVGSSRVVVWPRSGSGDGAPFRTDFFALKFAKFLAARLQTCTTHHIRGLDQRYSLVGPSTLQDAVRSSCACSQQRRCAAAQDGLWVVSSSVSWPVFEGNLAQRTVFATSQKYRMLTI